MKRMKMEWNQCWEVAIEAGEWSLHEEEDEGVELMLGGGDRSERLVIGWEEEVDAAESIPCMERLKREWNQCWEVDGSQPCW
jgi:hypothetical protein